MFDHDEMIEVNYHSVNKVNVHCEQGTQLPALAAEQLTVTFFGMAEHGTAGWT